MKSAATLKQSPDDNGIEVAFVGRSNAGKSSALNAITRQTKLARTSKTPGRTQLMNYFELDPQRRLVDLPGYGYAKIPAAVRKQIESLLIAYLTNRQCLAGLILLMDIRHPLTSNDQQLIALMEEAQKPIHILLTKCDKLKRGAQQQALLATRRALKDYPQPVTVQCFSALDKTGLDDVHAKLNEWFETQTPSV
jgi:GTP-binding protein